MAGVDDNWDLSVDGDRGGTELEEGVEEGVGLTEATSRETSSLHVEDAAAG